MGLDYRKVLVSPDEPVKKYYTVDENEIEYIVLDLTRAAIHAIDVGNFNAAKRRLNVIDGILSREQR